MTAPLFSIITTSYNYAPYIGSALTSVLRQTLDDWELLVVDDCSTDDSWDIIAGFRDPRIKAFRNTDNHGACAAYNRALALATGINIASLDSDDMFEPTKLERQSAFLAEHPEVGVCGTYVTEIDSSGCALDRDEIYAPWFNVGADLNDPARWISENRLCHSSAVVRSAIHRRIGEFDKRFTYTPDWDFWLRAMTGDVRFAVIPDRLTVYRSHGSNITPRDPAGAILEHAVTCSEILYPWLHEVGRSDLVRHSLMGFLNPTEGSRHLVQEVGKRLFAGPAAANTAGVLLELTSAKLQELTAIADGKGWIEGQLYAHQAALAEAQKESARIEAQVGALQAALIAAQKEVARIEAQREDMESQLAKLQTSFWARVLFALGLRHR